MQQRSSSQGGEPDYSPLSAQTLAGWFAEGSHADIFRASAHGKAYVVKVGKTASYAPPFLKALPWRVSRARANEFLTRFLGPSFSVLPDEANIRVGLAEYRLLESYFSDSREAQNHRVALRQVLDALDDGFSQQIRRLVGDAGVHQLRRGLGMRAAERFLPKELVAIGHPTVRDRHESGGFQKLGLTYFIIQQDMAGETVIPLSAATDGLFARSPSVLDSLCTFALLARKMYYDTGLLIDTRPDEVLKHPLEWFQQTSNILVDLARGRVWFVDTRWLWRMDSVLGRDGLNLVEFLGVRSLDRALKHYCRIATESSPATRP